MLEIKRFRHIMAYGIMAYGIMAYGIMAYGIMAYGIMAYGNTPYVGMAPEKNGGHIESAEMTRSKCLR